MELPKNSVSAINAAKILGVAPVTMRLIMRRGKVKGIKIKKDWYIDLDSLKDYINQNGSQNSGEITINGEKAIRVSRFAKMFNLSEDRTERAIVSNSLNVVKYNGFRYIPKSEVRRYKRRFVEHFGKKIISIEEAALKSGLTIKQLSARISQNELSRVRVGNKRFVYADELAKLLEKLPAGEEFLSIPQNGRKRRDF